MTDDSLATPNPEEKPATGEVSSGSSPSSTTEPPNWVEIGTLAVAVLASVAGFIKFSQFDRILSDLDSELKRQEVAFNEQQVLQIEGALHIDAFPPTRLGSVAMTINNIRQVPVDIEKCELVVTPVAIPKKMQETLRKARAASLNSPDDLLLLDEQNGDDRVPTPSWLSVLAIEPSGSMSTRVVQDQPITHTYDPTEHSGGKVLAGQRRQIVFDLLLEEGTLPALHYITVKCWISGEDHPYTWESWIGLGGFPDRPAAAANSPFAAH